MFCTRFFSIKPTKLCSGLNACSWNELRMRTISVRNASRIYLSLQRAGKASEDLWKKLRLRRVTFGLSSFIYLFKIAFKGFDRGLNLWAIFRASTKMQFVRLQSEDSSHRQNSVFLLARHHARLSQHGLRRLRALWPTRLANRIPQSVVFSCVFQPPSPLRIELPNTSYKCCCLYRSYFYSNL
jgi:hypothetical protein